MQQYIEFAPSFNCYSCESRTSTVVDKVVREEGQLAPFHENGNIEVDDFEFSLVLDSGSWVVFPVFKREIKDIYHEIDASSLDTHESESSSYCMWKSKADGGWSPFMGKCKKSNSTVSKSKRWIFGYFLRRTNREPMVVLARKKVDSPKHVRNFGEVSEVGRRLKTQTPVHEQFYVQRRAENEIEKRKSYLPYRKDLVGLCVNVNGMGKMLPF